jgi:hypothetical protein
MSDPMVCPECGGPTYVPAGGEASSWNRETGQRCCRNAKCNSATNWWAVPIPRSAFLRNRLAADVAELRELGVPLTPAERFAGLPERYQTALLSDGAPARAPYGVSLRGTDEWVVSVLEAYGSWREIAVVDSRLAVAEAIAADMEARQLTAP